MKRHCPLIVALLAVTAFASPGLALDKAHREQARQVIARSIEFLRSTQNEDGSWTPKPGPAVTAMVAAGMLHEPDIDVSDPTVAGALDYVLSRRQDDGGIYEGILPNYNTSIALMALGQVGDDQRVAEVISEAHDFLRGLQWAEGDTDPDGNPITEDHPWYGGAGYGNSGRPDMSNTNLMLEGLYQSGMDCNDPAFQRALVFIARSQGAEANDMFKDLIELDGGFIYATSVNKNAIGVPESKASPEQIERAKAGKPLNSRLRTYGSMTYAGFKSYVYALLEKDDPRVVDAMKWIRRNYTLEQNPGLRDYPGTEVDERMQGYYYYLHTFAKALHAWGEPTITDAEGVKHDWANELIDKLAELQREDGSFVNEHDRWMEGDPNLVTAYALLALQTALGR